MPKTVSLAALVVFLLALAGCQLKSDRPLLGAETAVAIFDGDILVATLDDDGALSLNDRAETATSAFTRSGSLYVMKQGGKREELSFHPLEGQRGLYLAQLTGPDGSASYGLVRPAPGRLPVKTIALDSDTRKALTQLGYKLSYKDSVTRVGDRESLMAAVEAFVRIKAGSLAAFTKGDLTYALAVGEAEIGALSGIAKQVRCLALAGHPYDPAMKSVDKKFRSGSRLAEIDFEPARKACAAAVRTAAGRAAASPSAGYAYARTLFLAKDYPAFQAQIEALRRQDFPLAHVFAADVLIRGTGVPRDTAAARRILEEKAGASPLVRHFLGFYHLNGRFDGTPDPAQAAVLFESAMSDGFAPARVEFGKLQRAGKGVHKDPAAAFRNFRIAAEAGVGEGALETGRALYFGYGTLQNYEQAYGMIRRAIDHRLADAYYIGGFMKSRGQGTEKDERMAAGWFRLGAGRGSRAAKGELGRALYYGYGVTADKVRGRALIEEAAAAGDRNSQTYLEQIGKAQGGGGKSSIFVSSCQSQFNRSQCECLADTARVAMPDVHRRTYRRAIIEELIQRNPILGLQLGVSCGITSY